MECKVCEGTGESFVVLCLWHS